MEVIDSLLVNYPFLPSAREKLNDYPLEDETVRMLHDVIMNQAQYRIDSAATSQQIPIISTRREALATPSS